MTNKKLDKIKLFILLKVIRIFRIITDRSDGSIDLLSIFLG